MVTESKSPPKTLWRMSPNFAHMNVSVEHQVVHQYEMRTRLGLLTNQSQLIRPEQTRLAETRKEQNRKGEPFSILTRLSSLSLLTVRVCPEDSNKQRGGK
jgi:hypothetical protein